MSDDAEGDSAGEPESEDANGPALPQGPDVACLDAMALFLFHNNGRFPDLEALFAAGAYTPDVVLSIEVGGTAAWRARNQDILAATWLHKAPVLTGTDAAIVNNLLQVWNSPVNQDRGEAEAVVLCQRHGWVAITDDAKKGRPELERRGLHYCYVITMLLYAAATGQAGMDAASAWSLSRDIQQSRAKPYVASETHFKLLAEAAKKVWEANGKPPWPRMLADWKIDQLVDRADGRTPIRPSR